jgi:DNA-binding NarL/FixJ family response regulator
MPQTEPFSHSNISVLLVDDHSLVRHGFRRMLEDEPGISVVGEASDGFEAVESAIALRPRVIVMDFALPSMNGAVATRRILNALPDARVLMLSMHIEPDYVRTCLDAGARGYLLKNAMDLELVDAVRRIAAGEQVLDPRLGRLDGASSGRPGEPATSLTTRELEVLQLIVHGKSNKEIAVVLGLSANTISVHRANIMQTLQIHNTAALVVYAIRTGLVSIT